jgi:hypothetical protein
MEKVIKCETEIVIYSYIQRRLRILENLGKILKGILSTQLPNTIIFKPYFQYLNKKRQEKVQPCFQYN